MATKKLKLQFDSKLYPHEAVMGAAYKMLDEIYVHLESAEVAVVANIALKNGAPSPLEKYAEAFNEEVLSQTLRIKILKATRHTRDQILKIAITYGPFLQQQEHQPTLQPCEAERIHEEIDAELESILKQLKEEDIEHDFASDPMGILVPWEERNPGEIERESNPALEPPCEVKSDACVKVR